MSGIRSDSRCAGRSPTTRRWWRSSGGELATLQEVAESHSEAALLGALLYIRLGLGLLLVRQRLLARQTDATAAFLDPEDEHLHLAAGGEHLAMIGAARGPQLGVRHQSGLARAHAH